MSLWTEPTQSEIFTILSKAKRIAVVGASTDPSRPSFQVIDYLKRNTDYEIYPVNPKEDSINSLKCFPNLKAIPSPIDICVVFRKIDALPEVLSEAIEVAPKVFWLQLDLRDDLVADRGVSAGLVVVQDRCIKIEHTKMVRSGFRLPEEFKPIHLTQDSPYCWSGVEELVYKVENGSATFKDVTRRRLFSEGAPSGMELRYFEVAPGGHTTLEKHEHIHLVIPIRGSGRCLVGDRVVDLRVNDLVHVPSWAWHQFRASESDYLGFLCLVTVERDRPTLPNEEELAQLRANPTVAEFIRV